MIKITKTHFHRKSKSKFLHTADNSWTKCIVTKRNDITIYEKKSVPERELFGQTSPVVVSEKFPSSSLQLTVNGKIIGYIPKALSAILEAIEKSKYILDLQENWDDQGAVKYDFDVWKKAVLFISKLSTKIYKTSGQIIKTPKIYHGPNGSIDIYWENELYNLLFNIPKNGLGTFYGDNYNNIKSEGFFDPSTITVNIFPFLMEFK